MGSPSLRGEKRFFFHTAAQGCQIVFEINAHLYYFQFSIVEEISYTVLFLKKKVEDLKVTGTANLQFLHNSECSLKNWLYILHVKSKNSTTQSIWSKLLECKNPRSRDIWRSVGRGCVVGIKCWRIERDNCNNVNTHHHYEFNKVGHSYKHNQAD